MVAEKVTLLSEKAHLLITAVWTLHANLFRIVLHFIHKKASQKVVQCHSNINTEKAYAQMPYLEV